MLVCMTLCSRKHVHLRGLAVKAVCKGYHPVKWMPCGRTGLNPTRCWRPCAQAWRRTAQSVEALALSLQREVPDTAATMRLSGLELADAIGEVTLLGADLTEAC